MTPAPRTTTVSPKPQTSRWKRWLRASAFLVTAYLWLSCSMTVVILRISAPWEPWQSRLVVLGNEFPLVHFWHHLLLQLESTWPSGDGVLLGVISGTLAFQVAAWNVAPPYSEPNPRSRDALLLRGTSIAELFAWRTHTMRSPLSVSPNPVVRRKQAPRVADCLTAAPPRNHQNADECHKPLLDQQRLN